jgi:hypothetical protein
MISAPVLVEPQRKKMEAAHNVWRSRDKVLARRVTRQCVCGIDGGVAFCEKPASWDGAQTFQQLH